MQALHRRRYHQGVHNPLNVDRMPFTGFDTTWSLKPAAAPPYLPDYDPDSASTGTMWATGQKTLDERISQGPSSAINVPGANLTTVLEPAQKNGMKVGDVSTAEITDATPAVLASHISLRGCQGPTDMGPARWRPRVQSALDKGYRYVTDADGLSTVANGNKPLLELFNPSNMSCEWTGPAASLGKGNAPAACTDGQRPTSEPSLAAMTKRAIDAPPATAARMRYPPRLPRASSTPAQSCLYGAAAPGALAVLGTNDHTDLFDLLGG